jgi:hypothetical protein
LDTGGAVWEVGASARRAPRRELVADVGRAPRAHPHVLQRGAPLHDIASRRDYTWLYFLGRIVLSHVDTVGTVGTKRSACVVVGRAGAACDRLASVTGEPPVKIWTLRRGWNRVTNTSSISLNRVHSRSPNRVGFRFLLIDLCFVCPQLQRIRLFRFRLFVWSWMFVSFYVCYI